MVRRSARRSPRANMRFVATKNAEQQGCLMLHRTRASFHSPTDRRINAIRARSAEFGVALVGRNGVEQLLNGVADLNDDGCPA